MTIFSILLLLLFANSTIAQLCASRPLPDMEEFRDVAVNHLNKFLPVGKPYVKSTIHALEEIPPPYVAYKISINLTAACRGTVCPFPNEICSMTIFLRNNGEAEVRPETVHCQDLEPPTTRPSDQDVFLKFTFNENNTSSDLDEREEECP